MEKSQELIGILQAISIVAKSLAAKLMQIEKEVEAYEAAKAAHDRKMKKGFYRPDFARDRDKGGNGLGLYIVDTLLKTMDISYSFCPMEEPQGMRFTIHL